MGLPAQNSTGGDDGSVIDQDAGLPLSKQGQAQSALQASGQSALGISVRGLSELDLGHARDLILQGVGNAIKFFAFQEKKVYLDQLGFIVPTRITRPCERAVDQRLIVQQETIIRLEFDKSLESNVLTGEAAIGLVELSDFCYGNLPLSFQARWTDQKFRSILRGIIREFRTKLLSTGMVSLPEIGWLIALNNRRGATKRDSLYSAEIFLESNLEVRLKVSTPHSFIRPTIRSSWELLSALYGKPLGGFEIDPQKELHGLVARPKSTSPFLAKTEIKVGVFVKPALKSESKTELHSTVLVYATDGLRQLGQANGHLGSELVFQLRLNATSVELDPSQIPAWPARVIALGWQILATSRNGNALPGDWLDFATQLIDGCDSEIRSLLVTPFRPLVSPYLDSAGSFVLVNLVGITEDEALIGKQNPEILSAILKRKGLEQSTRITRSSCLAHTAICANVLQASYRGF